VKDILSLNVLSPKGDVKVSQTATSTRLSSLDGKKIGILENNKPGALMLLPYLLEGIKKQVAGVEIRVWKIPRHWSDEEKEPLLKEISGYSDAVIGLMGE
jgi:hypothetical protein